MSVNCTFYTVDWEALRRGYAARQQDFIHDGVDKEADWVEGVELDDHQRYCFRNWRAYNDFAEVLEELAGSGDIGADEAAALRSFFQAVGVLITPTPFDELANNRVEGIYVAMSPESVKRFSAMANSLTFEPHLERLDRITSGREDGVFSDGDHIQGYLEGWQQILEEAASAGRGLLILAG